MVEIISFKTRQRVKKESPSEEEEDSVFVWTCCECDGDTFNLHQNGEVYCSSCETFMHDIRTFDPEE